MTNLPVKHTPSAVPVGEDMREVFQGLAHVGKMAPAFLEGYYRTGLAMQTCRDLGIEESNPRKWKERHPEFGVVYDEITEVCNNRWDETGDRHATEGFEERMYDKEGKLAGSRIRQDPGFLKAVLASKLPHYRPNEQSTEIQVNVLVRNE